MDAESVFERASASEISEVSDGYVVYDTSSERVHFLNATAAAIYDLCDGERSLENIADIIDEGYGQEGTSRPDVEGCLELLLRERLIRQCP